MMGSRTVRSSGPRHWRSWAAGSHLSHHSMSAWLESRRLKFQVLTPRWPSSVPSPWPSLPRAIMVQLSLSGHQYPVGKTFEIILIQDFNVLLSVQWWVKHQHCLVQRRSKFWARKWGLLLRASELELEKLDRELNNLPLPAAALKVKSLATNSWDIKPICQEMMTTSATDPRLFWMTSLIHCTPANQPSHSETVARRTVSTCSEAWSMWILEEESILVRVRTCLQTNK